MVLVVSIVDPAKVDPADAVASEVVDVADVAGSTVAMIVLESADRDD